MSDTRYDVIGAEYAATRREEVPAGFERRLRAIRLQERSGCES